MVAVHNRQHAIMGRLHWIPSKGLCTVPPADSVWPDLSKACPWPVEWLLAALTGRDLPPLPSVDDPWGAIVAVAVQHRLAPLLWARLKERPEATTLPVDFIQRVRTMYLMNAARGMRHIQELGRILQALDAAGIPTVVLKGACLAQEVYGNLALRIIGDADLMVPEPMLEQAAGVLEQVGYHPQFAYEQTIEMEWLQHLPPFSRPEGVVVELHWTIIFPRMNVCFTLTDLSDIWKRTRSIRLGGASGLTLAPEDMLLHLCVHASGQHLFLSVGLRALFDVAELLCRYGDELIWQEFVARCRAWDIERSAYLVLWLAKSLAGANVPVHVLEELSPTEIPATVVAQATANILQVSDNALAAPGFVEFGAQPTISGKMHALWTYAFLKPTDMARLYPACADSWRIMFCYPARWLYLFRQYGSGAGSLLRKNSGLLRSVQNQDILTLWVRSGTHE
jgi:hypothetical protein